MKPQTNTNEGLSSFQLYQKPRELTPQRCQRIVKYARKRLRGEDGNCVDSNDSSASTNLDVISHSQITLGHQLGKGAFSSVYSISSISKENEAGSEYESEKMVVKFLRTKLYDNHGLFAASAADLVKEGNILSSLCHTNVIHLHAVSSLNGVDAYLNGFHDAYFLVLERLEYTLSNQIEDWQSRHKELYGRFELDENYNPSAQFVSGSLHSSSWKSKLASFRLKKASDEFLENSERTTATNCTAASSVDSIDGLDTSGNNAALLKTKLLEERLYVAEQLADAIAHLHDNNVIHRDLKPDNIGFDADGVLKVFDFDIARVVPEVENLEGVRSEIEDEKFRMTQRVGSPRYMSPECARKESYNLKADVYSYALLAHQILTLEKPYDDISDEDHDDLVFYKGVRPHIPVGLPSSMKDLFRRAWSNKISERPTMEVIRQILAEQHDEIIRLGTIERIASYIPVANTTAYVWSCSFKSISDNNKMLKKLKMKGKKIIRNGSKGDVCNGKSKGLLSVFRRNKNNTEKMGISKSDPLEYNPTRFRLRNASQ